MSKFHSVIEQPLEEESYFVSMTDMMVGLLFIFILMLMYFALQYQSTTDQLTSANETRGTIMNEIKESLKKQGFDVEIDPVSDILRLNEEVLRFASGSAIVEPQYHGVIVALANALDKVLPCYANQEAYNQRSCTGNDDKHWLEAVFVEGHTDNVPYVGGNLKLSTERAANTYVELIKARSAIESLENSSGQPLLSVSGYGEKRPMDEAKNNATLEHRKMNRRIELRIIMATPGQNNASQSVINSIQGKMKNDRPSEFH